MPEYPVKRGTIQVVIERDTTQVVVENEHFTCYWKDRVYTKEINSAYTKLFGEIWFNEVRGGYSNIGLISFVTPLEGADALGDPRGGGCEYEIGLVHYVLLVDVNDHLWGSVGKDGTYNAWCRDEQTCYWFTHTTAYPSEGYHFDHWVLDGVTHDENPITVNTTIHNVAIFKNLVAYFAAN